MDGTLRATGDNWAGQLGDGTTTDKNSSILVDENVTGVTGGYGASYYLKKIAQFGQWEKVGMESWEMAGM